MAKKSNGSLLDAGKKRKLESEADADSATNKRVRASPGTGDLAPSLLRKLEQGTRTSSLGDDAAASAGAVDQDAEEGEGIQLTEEDLALRRQRREAKRAKKEVKRMKRQAKAAAKLNERTTTALAVKKHWKDIKHHRRLDWTLSSPSAGRILDQDPVFVRSSTGQEYLVVANHTEVQLLSQETSTVVKASPAPNASHVQCFASSSTEDGVVFIAHSDGSMAKWEVDIDEPAHQISNGHGNVKAFTVMPVLGNDHGRLLCLTRVGNLHVITEGGKTLCETPLQLDTIQSVGLQYIVATGPMGIVLGFNKSSPKNTPEFVWAEVPAPKPITSADARLISTANPGKHGQRQRHGLSLALGFTDGEVHLFDDVSTLFDSSDGPILPTPRILHWHRDAVSSAKFSRDGNYIISGGKETVLVLWQLTTGKKSFLPHLTSTIDRVVVNSRGDRYALRMGDNSVMVLSTSELKPVANFAGLQLALAPKKHATSALANSTAAVIHTQDSNQLLTTVPASQPRGDSDVATRPFLQTFDLRNSKHITRQALTRNNVTDFRSTPDGAPIQPPDVHLLQISKDGQWLATVDEWMPPVADLTYLAPNNPALLEEERRKRKEVYLKFWSWDQQQDLWILATRVDAPHERSSTGIQGAGRVFALATDSSPRGFATMGEDHCVRIWKPKLRMRHGVTVKDEDGRDLVAWTCKSIVRLMEGTLSPESPAGLYERPVPTAGHLTYSDDGSVIAAAITNGSSEDPPLIYFINAATGEAIPKANLAPIDLTQIGFLDRHFIVVSRKSVHVWDLITGHLSNQVRLPGGDGEVIPKLAVNPIARNFAVAAGSNVSVYDVSNATWISKVFTATNVTSLLASARGYLVLSTDASIRTLTPNSLANPQLVTPSSSDAEAIEAEIESVEVDAAGPDLLNSSRADSSTNEQGLLLEDDEDDRPVVRPEQLAIIFDGGHSFALPPVKDMFGAIADLFGRKPYVAQPIL